MKIRRDDFDWMTPFEFYKTIEIWEKKEETELHNSYELSRFNSWLNLSPHIKKNTSQLDLIRFPWENISKGKVIEWQGQPNIKN